MAATQRQLVLDAIETALQGITVANGYRSDMKSVTRTIRNRDQVGHGERPAVGVMPRRTSRTYETSDLYLGTMTVEFIGVVQSETSSTLAEAATEVSVKSCDMLADLTKALCADPTFGGVAINSTIRAEETSEGDPNSDQHNGGLFAEVYVELEVKYQGANDGSI